MSSIAKIEWRAFFTEFYERIFGAEIFGRAAQVAFYFAFALFPFLYFLVSLFGLLLDTSDGLKNELFTYLHQIMPISVFELLTKTVDEIVVGSTGSKAAIGLAVTLYAASAGIDAVRNGLNAVYELKERRSFWLTKVQSLSLTLLIMILVAMVLVTVFYGWQLVQYSLAQVGLQVTSPLVLVTVQWVSILVLMLLVCEITYNLLPDFKVLRWAWVTPGSVVAILLWIVLTTAFRSYLGYFNSYNRAYGSLAAVMVMMLWLYLTALALMVGGAINSVWAKLTHREAETVDGR